MYAPPDEFDPTNELNKLDIPFRAFEMRSFADLAIIPRLTRALKRERPDILHCHLLRANLYGRLIAKLAGIPNVICTLHNVADCHLGNTPFHRLIHGVERGTSGLVTMYVGVAEEVRRSAVMDLGIRSSKVIAIPNGIRGTMPTECGNELRAEVRRELALPEGAIVVGCVGALEPRKSYNDLIEVAQRCRSQAKDVVFIIFGDGPLRQTLETDVARRGLTNIVRLMGFRRDVSRLLTACDVFASTSRNEGLACALLEAMSASLPVITTSAGGNGEAVLDGQTGFVDERECLDAYASKLTLLVSDSALRRRMGDAGREHFLRYFTDEAMSASYCQLYHRIAHDEVSNRGTETMTMTMSSQCEGRGRRPSRRSA